MGAIIPACDPLADPSARHQTGAQAHFQWLAVIDTVPRVHSASGQVLVRVPLCAMTALHGRMGGKIKGSGCGVGDVDGRAKGRFGLRLGGTKTGGLQKIYADGKFVHLHR